MCVERAFLYRPLPPILLVAFSLPTAPQNRGRVEGCSDPEWSAGEQLHHQPAIHQSLQRRSVGDGPGQQDGFHLALDPGGD